MNCPRRRFRGALGAASNDAPVLRAFPGNGEAFQLMWAAAQSTYDREVQLRLLLTFVLCLALAGCGAHGGMSAASTTLVANPASMQPSDGHYTNPLPIALAGGHLAESCPDPAVIRSQSPEDAAW